METVIKFGPCNKLFEYSITPVVFNFPRKTKTNNCIYQWWAMSNDIKCNIVLSSSIDSIITFLNLCRNLARAGVVDPGRPLNRLFKIVSFWFKPFGSFRFVHNPFQIDCSVPQRELLFTSKPNRWDSSRVWLLSPLISGQQIRPRHHHKFTPSKSVNRNPVCLI